MREIATEPGTIAVLVVHGIGAQEPGESLKKLLAGLERAERDSGPNETSDGVRMVGGQPVRLYEVYWADLLKGDITLGAFRMNELQSFSWFPWFNLRRGNYPRGSYSFLKLAWWCVALPIVNFFVLFAYYGAGVFTQIVSGTEGRRKEDEKDSTVWRMAKKAAGRSAKLTRVDSILDEYVGDIFSYVNSAGNAFYREKDEPPVPEEVEHVYTYIVQRFYDQLLKAQADGCASIQIVAHSLGTVVTYHALSGLRFDPDSRSDAAAIRSASARISRIYTIGSPLEKIRFFWPRLVSTEAPLGGAKIQWDNFVSWFDPVAGRLRGFGEWGEVTNHRLLGGGFFRGHVVYEHSEVFLSALIHGLCKRDIPFERTRKERWWDLLVLVGETLLAPTVLAVLLILGAALFALTAMLIPYFLSWILRLFLPRDTWAPIVDTTSLVLLGVMILVFLVAPAIRARRVHSLYWSTPKESRPRSET